MNINRQDIESEAQKLWKDKTWKGQLFLGGICVAIVILLSMGLAEIAVGIAKLFFGIAAVYFLCVAAYHGFPTWKRWFESR